MNLKPVKIIAVDFDGTLCENNWPGIGAPNEELIEYLRNRKKDGDKLILWTCRVEDMLQKAVEWCKERNLVFDAVNENLPEIIENFGSDTRKIFANEYIDDRNIPLSSCREKSNMQTWAEKEVEIACENEKTIERLLKELGERHFEVLWRYEVLTNSIVIQMDKRYCHQWYRLARKVTLDDFHHFITNQFEDTMVRFLKEMAQELEYQIKVAPEPMKGEDND